MTVSTEDFRWAYTSTGGTTYQYLNKILDEDDLAVYVDGVLQAIGTDYSVTGVGTAAGGNVVFGAAPTAGSVVLITKDGVQFTQEHDYTENDPFPAASHEDALDKQTNLAQRIWDYVRRSVKVAITSTLTDLELPTPSAGKYLGWNDTATGLSNLTPTSLGSISDDAYSSTAWDGASEVAPSKNAVRDVIETKTAKATATEIIAGVEGEKVITPYNLAASHMLIPVGMEIMWPTETAPDGWLEENGASLLRASYPALFAVIGTMYGTADATHFNLPDMRGKFPRIWDHAATVDPDAATRTAPTATGATLTAGDHVGTEQADALEEHRHMTGAAIAAAGADPDRMPGHAAGITSGVFNTTGAKSATTNDWIGGNETRPVNAYRMMIIKY